MVTSNLMDKPLLCQIVPRKILGKFGRLSLLIKIVINVQSQCGHNRASPGLNMVKVGKYVGCFFFSSSLQNDLRIVKTLKMIVYYMIAN